MSKGGSCSSEVVSCFPCLECCDRVDHTELTGCGSVVDCNAPTLGVCSLCSFRPLGLAHCLCGVGCWCRHCELTHQDVGVDIVTERNTSMLVHSGVGTDIVTDEHTRMLVQTLWLTNTLGCWCRHCDWWTHQDVGPLRCWCRHCDWRTHQDVGADLVTDEHTRMLVQTLWLMKIFHTTHYAPLSKVQGYTGTRKTNTGNVGWPSH